MEQVQILLDTASHTEKEKDAWDYCRAAQLLGMFYIAGYMTREEMMKEAHKAAEVMKANYNSWEELCESYIAGYAEWVGDENAVAQRRAVYEKLKSIPNGPYSVAWNTAV